ncbi:hypothetical protein PR048_029050 [Dryococelus australis]|uniref:Uncharacterized protein n=1 Tax=Dryococelus australis TaxID=614101 RepID=A0ABQ9GC98_9NEOP|nr:hypothetical protein PR048_029050 [Dryococelus australis]
MTEENLRRLFKKDSWCGYTILKGRRDIARSYRNLGKSDLRTGQCYALQLPRAVIGDPPRPPLSLERCDRGWLLPFWESRECRQRRDLLASQTSSRLLEFPIRLAMTQECSGETVWRLSPPRRITRVGEDSRWRPKTYIYCRYPAAGSTVKFSYVHAAQQEHRTPVQIRVRSGYDPPDWHGSVALIAPAVLELRMRKTAAVPLDRRKNKVRRVNKTTLSPRALPVADRGHLLLPPRTLPFRSLRMRALWEGKHEFLPPTPLFKFAVEHAVKIDYYETVATSNDTNLDQHLHNVKINFSPPPPPHSAIITKWLHPLLGDTVLSLEETTGLLPYPTKANRVRFPAGLPPNFRTLVSYRKIPLVGGFSLGYNLNMRIWNSAGMKRRGETGDPRENPLTSGIVQHDSHMPKSGSDPAGD